MKKVIVLILLLFLTTPLFAYRYRYAEQYYKLFHEHHYHYPENSIENIHYLLNARSSPFVNPLYALTKIEDKKHWEKYRYLFLMHINLLLVKEYLLLGDKYDKYNAYFYNAPWEAQKLDSLKIAADVYTTAYDYWKDVKEWAEKGTEKRFYWIELEGIARAWQDEMAEVMDGSLDYHRIITSHLQRLDRVRQNFQSMDKNTY